ncbi:MAG: TIGR04086 family membrane protein [Oscillospiraceae bacterium]
MEKSKRSFAIEGPKEFMRASAQTGGAAVIVTTALMSVVAALMANIDVSHDLYAPITTIVTALSTLLASYATGKSRKNNGLAIGVVAGMLVFAVLGLLSAIFMREGLTPQAIYKFFAIASAGGVGGVLGVSSKDKPKKLAKSQK